MRNPGVVQREEGGGEEDSLLLKEAKWTDKWPEPSQAERWQIARKKINKDTKDIQKIDKSHIVWKSVKLSHFTKWRAKRATFNSKLLRSFEAIWGSWDNLRILRLFEDIEVIEVIDVIEVIWGCCDHLRILRSFEAMMLLRSFEDVRIIWRYWGH